MAIAAEGAARYLFVCLGPLQLPYRIGSHAHHVVAVTWRVAGGLDPGDPRMPGSVSFMPLPAQQMANSASGQLHDRRRPWLAIEQPAILTSHKIMIRNRVLMSSYGFA